MEEIEKTWNYKMYPIRKDVFTPFSGEENYAAGEGSNYRPWDILGEKGWELVSVTEDEETITGYFKRECKHIDREMEEKKILDEIYGKF